jgi:hypothetical protein
VTKSKRHNHLWQSDQTNSYHRRQDTLTIITAGKAPPPKNTKPKKYVVGKTALLAKPFLSNSKSVEKATGRPNGLRYLRVGGRGFCLGAGKTRSQKNA